MKDLDVSEPYETENTEGDLNEDDGTARRCGIHGYDGYFRRVLTVVQ